jgi:lysine 2,3-aminomutase
LLVEKGGLKTPLPIKSVDDLTRFLSLKGAPQEGIRRVTAQYPFKIPKFYLDLMDGQDPCCPIRRQAIPSIEELADEGEEDPLCERQISVTPSFLKRYPGRGVFLVTAQCAMYCRFCNRKRFAGKEWDPRTSWEDTFRYLEKTDDVREVILSGGDPFMLLPDELDYILSRLRKVKRIGNVRISTRVPVVDPEALSKAHVKATSKTWPLWLVVHINHPKEVTRAFIDTIGNLRRAGSVVLSQTVLLRGVNDCPHILLKLFSLLLTCGVKPYYLFQLDEVRGASHFKVRLRRGMGIMRILRLQGSGLAIPQYVLDITGGLGKVPVDSQHVRKGTGTKVFVQNASGTAGIYRDDGKASRCLGCGICGKKPFGRNHYGWGADNNGTV